MTLPSLSLSTSKRPSASDLKGTLRWPIVVAMRPTIGVFLRPPEMIILTLPTFLMGHMVTASIVSKKDVWLQTKHTGRPVSPNLLRNSARPSTVLWIHGLMPRPTRQNADCTVIMTLPVHFLLRKHCRHWRTTARNQVGTVVTASTPPKPTTPAFFLPRQPMQPAAPATAAPTAARV